MLTAPHLAVTRHVYGEAMTSLGYLAGTLTTLSFLPQVIRSLRMRNATELSWLWLVCFGCGITAWVGYGIVRGDPAIIVSNAVTLLAVLVLVWLRATAEAPVVNETITIVEQHTSVTLEQTDDIR
jgi:MtN3 and saliva related transmembrane protein